MGKSVLFLIISLAVSVRTQTAELCPAEEDILPCRCYVGGFDARPRIECSAIEDEEQLENIFSVDFPESKIQYFTLSESGIERLSKNVFGHVSFDDVSIDYGNLNEIAEDAFKSSSETLINFSIDSNPITEYSFPFGNLENYTLLDTLTLSDNRISEFPTIVSESLSSLSINYYIDLTNIPSQALVSVPNLKSLELRNCFIDTIANDAFKGLDQLEYLRLTLNSIVNITAEMFSYVPSVLKIYLDANFITDIEPGTFDNLPSLQCIDLGSNRLSRLNTDTFRGVNVANILIDNNFINIIEANAFRTVSSSSVHLWGNLLTNLYEFWLQPLLDAGNVVYLSDNPIKCDCGISWLFSDPTYQENVLFYCENGTYFSDLDPDYYTANC